MRMKIEVPKDEMQGEVGVWKLEEGLEGGGIHNIIIKIDHPKVEAMGPDFQELDAQVSNKVIAGNHLQRGRPSGMGTLEFSDISHDLSMGGVSVVGVEQEPSGVSYTAQHVDAMKMSIRACYRDATEPRFLNK